MKGLTHKQSVAVERKGITTPAKKALEKRQQSGQKRKRRPWTEEEVQNLRAGVDHFGAGNWTDIVNNYEFNDRTPVDAKDKWRNLIKQGREKK